MIIKRQDASASSALDAIRDRYINMHPRTGEVDLAIARDYFVNCKAVRFLALEYGYHEYTVYNKIGNVRNLVETANDYEHLVLPKSLTLELFSMNDSSINMLAMTFAKYQTTRSTTIKRADIVNRYPDLMHRQMLQRCIDELRQATGVYDCSGWDSLSLVLGNQPFRFDVYESIEYTKAELRYTFTESMRCVLDCGRWIDPRDLDKED